MDGALDLFETCFFKKLERKQLRRLDLVTHKYWNKTLRVQSRMRLCEAANPVVAVVNYHSLVSTPEGLTLRHPLDVGGLSTTSHVKPSKSLLARATDAV